MELFEDEEEKNLISVFEANCVINGASIVADALLGYVYAAS
jgi:hypothetical protein